MYLYIRKWVAVIDYNVELPYKWEDKAISAL